MKIVIDKVIKELRTSKNISQEVLAEKAGVSVQAVSKWENGLSCPDIALLPELADFFGVSCGYLLTGKAEGSISLPDDGVLRIVQAVGSRVLDRNEFDKEHEIKVKFPDINEQPSLNMEVWGNFSVDGGINGSVNAGGCINCGNITVSAQAGDGINCGNINGSAQAGGGINCGNINGDASAGGSINCGNIGGDILSCADDIHCSEIRGDIMSCAGDIIYEK